MADPAERTDDLVDEAQRGRSERTPWLVWGGMHLVVGALVAVVLGIALLAYLIA